MRASWTGLEALEPRLLLSATVQLDIEGNAVFEGSAGADTVVLREDARTGSLEYSFNGIDFARDFDPLAPGEQTVQAAGAAVRVDLGDGNDRIEIVQSAGEGRFSIESGRSTLHAPGSDIALQITFDEVEGVRLSGGEGADVFELGDTGALELLVDGGGGTDRLEGSDADTVWNLTAENQGSLVGEVAEGAMVAFVSIESLLGGAGDDTFVLENGGGVRGLVDGGGGVNTLDYSQHTGDVTVGLAGGAGVASGTGGVANIHFVIAGARPGSRVIIAELSELKASGGDQAPVQVSQSTPALAVVSGSIQRASDFARQVAAEERRAATTVEHTAAADLETPLRASEDSMAAPAEQIHFVFGARGPPSGDVQLMPSEGSLIIRRAGGDLLIATAPQEARVEQLAAGVNVALIAAAVGRIRSREERLARAQDQAEGARPARSTNIFFADRPLGRLAHWGAADRTRSSLPEHVSVAVLEAARPGPSPRALRHKTSSAPDRATESAAPIARATRIPATRGPPIAAPPSASLPHSPIPFLPASAEDLHPLEVDAPAPQIQQPTGDLNQDGAVDQLDLDLVLATWGPCGGESEPCPADVNVDGVVDVRDLSLVVTNWTFGPGPAPLQAPLVSSLHGTPPTALEVSHGPAALTLRRSGDRLALVDSATGRTVAEQETVATSQILVQGRADVDDTLTIDFSGGPIEAPVVFHGGDRGFDTLVLSGGQFDRARYIAAGPDSGTIELDALTITYTGLEPIDDNNNVADRVFTGTFLPDEIHLSAGSVAGTLLITSENLTFESIQFANPTSRLTILGGDGNDTIVIEALGSFSGALKIDGELGLADTVTFTSSLSLPGRGVFDAAADDFLPKLDVAAETITVEAGVSISTRMAVAGGPSSGHSGGISLHGRAITVEAGAALLAHVQAGSSFEAGDVLLLAEDLGVRPLVNVNPFLTFQNRSATITISGATIRGGEITLESTSEDINPLSEIPEWVASSLISPFTSTLEQFAAMKFPVSVMIRGSQTAVTVEDSTLDASGGVTIQATTKVDSSLQAIALTSVAIAAGYAQAEAIAEAMITGTTQIAAADDVSITSEVSNKAQVTARVSANLGGVSPPSANAAGASLAIANTHTISKAIVEAGTSITSGGNVNVEALGEVKNSPGATTGLYLDGIGSVGVALSFDETNIEATVSGTVTAEGQLTAKEVDLSAVDGEENTITLPGHGLFGGEQVVYDTGGGAAIGGLADGLTFEVIVVDADTIRLARASAIDLDAADVDPSAVHSLSRAAALDFNPAAAVNIGADTVTIAGHGLSTGQSVTYIAYGEDVIEGLRDGEDYRVLNATTNTFRLGNVNTGQLINLQSSPGGTGGTHTIIFEEAPITFAPALGSVLDSDGDTITIPGHGFATGDAVVYRTDPSISRQVSGVRNAAFDPTSFISVSFTPSGAVDLDADTITIPEHGLSDGQQVTYEIGEGVEPVGGLVAGQVLFIDLVDEDTFKLAAVAGGPAIDLTAEGSPNLHRLRTGEKAVDLDADTIRIANHGLESGELVTYQVPADAAEVGGLLRDTAYEVQVVNEDTIRLRDAGTDQIIDLQDGATGTMHNLRGSVALEVEDVEVRGLADEETFFVVVIDESTIRLAESPNDAVAAAPIDLDPSVATLALDEDGEEISHELKTPQGAGIGIRAELEASNQATSGASIGGAPKIKDALTRAEVLPLISSIFQFKAADVLKGQAEGASQATSTNYSGSVSFGLNVFHHSAIARAGATAVLQSGIDVTIDAALTQKAKLVVTGGTGKKKGNLAVAVALGLGFYDNEARAIVEGGAVIDAQRRVTVGSRLEYPLLVKPLELIPFYSIEKNGLLKELATFIDGSFGLTGKLFNVFVSSSGSNPQTYNSDGTIKNTGVQYSAAGGFAYIQYINASEAVIRSGALVNQDASRRDALQSVSVQASTNMTLLNSSGMFSFGLTPESLKKLWKDGRKEVKSLFTFFGNQAARGGFGGSLLWQFLDNDTTAIIEGGAQVHAGQGGDGLAVSANEKIFSIDLAQAGGTSGNYGVSGSVSVVHQEGLTLAQLASGALVTTGPLRVTADSDLTRINIVGAVQKGRSVGAGVSVSRNFVLRETRAVIGTVPTEDAPGPGDAGTSIDATGDVNLNATADGAIWVFSLAGAVVAPAPPAPEPTQPTEGADDLPQSADTAGQGSSQGNQGSTGIGIAADVSINRVEEVTEALVNDRGQIASGGTITLESFDGTSIVAASGAAAISAQKGKTSVGLAGSFSFNDLVIKTRSAIVGTTIEAGKVDLDADQDRFMFALSAGGAGAPAQTGFAIAGSVSRNEIDNQTRSVLDGVDVTSATDVVLDAHDGSDILAIGGALSVGGKLGFGAAVGINLITTVTEAAVSGASGRSRLEADGHLDLTARNDNIIRSFTASVGAGTSGAGVAGTVSVDLIGGMTSARISGADVDAGMVSLEAEDDSNILSIAGAGAGGSRAGFGAAVAFNRIASTVIATIEDASVTSSSTVALDASATSDILSVSAGLVAAGSASLAGNVSLNFVRNTIDAHISSALTSGGNGVSAAGSITIEARDDSGIISTAGNAAFAGKAAIGAAVGFNDIGNMVKAFIADATVLSSGGDVEVRAEERARIIGIAAGGAGAGSYALGGSVSVNKIANIVHGYILGAGTLVDAQGHVAVLAVDDNDLVVVAGQVSGGGSAAVGIANTTVVTDTTVEASISGATIIGRVRGVRVDAESSETITAVAGGIAGAGSFGGVGSFTLNVLNETTLAHIDGGATINQQAPAGQGVDQSVTVEASDETQIVAVGAGIAVGGSGGLGAGADIEVSTKVTEAYITDSSVFARRDVIVQAYSQELLVSVAAAAAGGATFGGAGAAGVGVFDITTVAFIGEREMPLENTTPTLVVANGNVLVDALDFNRMNVFGGSLSIAGSGAAVGAVAAVPVLIKTTEAYLGGDAVVTARANGAGIEARTGGFDVSFTPPDDPVTGFTTQSVDGTDAVETITIAGHGLSTGDPVTYQNTGDGPDLDGLENGRTYFAIVVNADTIRLAESLDAAMDNAAIDLDPAGAADGHELKSDEGTFAFAPSDVDGSSAVETIIIADHGYESGDALIYHNDGNGMNLGGLSDGAVYYVIVVDEDTIKLAATRIEASEEIPVDLETSGSVSASHSLETFGEINAESSISDEAIESNGVDENLRNVRSASASTATMNGLTITANNIDDVRAVAVSLGGAAGGAVVLDAAVHVANVKTMAYIESGAAVNTVDNAGSSASQTVHVSAGSDSYHLSLGGGVAIAGYVGVAAGAAITVVDQETTAFIGEGALVAARADVLVTATARQEILSIAATIAGSGGVSLAVSVPVLVVNTQTHAFVAPGAVVSAQGTVLVAAIDDSVVNLIGGAAGVGIAGGGAGASVGVISITKDTQAYIGAGARVDAAGASDFTASVLSGEVDEFGFATHTIHGVAVQARSSEDVFGMAVAGGGGQYAGFAGGVTVQSIDSDTQAFIDGGALVNQAAGAAAEQSVNVSAGNELIVDTVTGAAAVALGVGLAGGVDVGVIRNDTAAYIGAGAVVSAASDVEVHAMANRDLHSLTFSASGGAGAMGAAVSVYSIGGNLDSEQQDEISANDGSDGTSGQHADEQSGSALEGNSDNLEHEPSDFRQSGGDVEMIGGVDTAQLATDGVADADEMSGAQSDRLAVDDDLTGVQPEAGTFASIGGLIVAGGDVNVRAAERIDFEASAGSGALGLLGVGASVVVANVNSSTQASLDEQASVVAGGTVRIGAEQENDLLGKGFAGSVGLVGVSGIVVVLNDNSVQEAFVGAAEEGAAGASSGPQVAAAASLEITAASTRTLDARSDGIALGLSNLALGVSEARATAGGSTRAFLGEGARIGASDGESVGDVRIGASSDTTVTSESLAIAGGVQAGVAARTIADIAPISEATAGAGSSIFAQGNVTLSATSVNSATATLDGLTGGSAAVGFLDARARIVPASTKSTVAAGGHIDAGGDVALESLTDNHAESRTGGGQGGLLTIGGQTSQALVDDLETLSTVGEEATIVAGGRLDVLSTHDSEVIADAKQTAGGAITINHVLAQAQILDAVTESALRPGATVDVGSLSLVATDREVSAKATSESNTVIAAYSRSEATSEADVATTSRARIDSGAQVNARTLTEIAARSQDVRSETDALAKTLGFAGDAIATSDNDLAPAARVIVEPLTTIVTTDLLVDAVAPHFGQNYIRTAEAATKTVTRIVRVIVGYICELVLGVFGLEELCEPVYDFVEQVLPSTEDRIFRGAKAISNEIDFNATVTIRGPGEAILEIGPAGGVVRAHNVALRPGAPSEILVNDIINETPGSITIEALHGGISGTTVFNVLTAFEAITITNHSSRHLRLHDIQSAPSEPAISIVAADGRQNLNHTIVTNTTVIDIHSTPASASAGDITLRGRIENFGGTTVIRNDGGDILAQGPAALIDTQVLEMRAERGTIGTAGSRIVGLLRSSQTAGSPAAQGTFAAQSVYFDVMAITDDGSPLEVDVTGIGADAGIIDIEIRDGVSREGERILEVTLDDGTIVRGVRVEDTIDPALAVDGAADTVRYAFAHGLTTGDEVVYGNGGGTSIGGLSDGAGYFVSVVDAMTFRLGRSPQEAAQDPITLFDGSVDVDGAEDTIDLGYAFIVLSDEGEELPVGSAGFRTGDAVIYRSGGGSPIGGLIDGATFYVVEVDGQRLALARTHEEATSAGRSRFDPATAVDSEADRIDFGVPHGFATGDLVVYSADGGEAIGGLQDGGRYYVRALGDTAIRLARSLEEAMQDEITFFNAQSDVDHLEDAIDLGYAHGFVSGDGVAYDIGGGAPVSGLSNGATYFVIPVDEQRLALAATAELARSARSVRFDPAVAVNSSQDTLDFGAAHGFSQAEAVVYTDGGGAGIGGLSDHGTYFVVVLSPTAIALAASAEDANAADPVLLDLNASSATGDDHGLHSDVRVDLAAGGAEGSQHTLRIGLDASVATGEAHSLDADVRIDLDPTVASGATHSLRLDLDPAPATGTAHSFRGNIYYLRDGETIVPVDARREISRDRARPADEVPTDSVYRIENLASARGDIDVVAGSNAAVRTDLLLSGVIEAPRGRASLATLTGDIVRTSDAQVVRARDVALAAPAGAIGSDETNVLVDLGSGRLDADARHDVHVTEVAGRMALGQVRSAEGDVVLSVPDLAGAGQDLLVLEQGEVSAHGGAVRLMAGDNITVARTAAIFGQNVTIFGDHGNVDPGTGTTIRIEGTLGGDSVVVFGNDDDDDVSLFGATYETAVSVRGGPGDDLLTAGRGPGTTRLFGEDGDDVLRGDVGRDELSGGPGRDDLSGGRNDDLLEGGDGDDTLRGDAGNDVLAGDAGVDLLRGGIGDDVLHGGDGGDQLFGDFGDDRLDGSAGEDVIDGGQSHDLVIFPGADGPVTVDLALGRTIDDGQGGTDQLTRIEGAIGTPFADVLRGDRFDNEFHGLGAGDKMTGEGGRDLFVWTDGDGEDTIDGGTGSDTLRVRTLEGDDALEVADTVGGDASFVVRRSGPDPFALSPQAIERVEIETGGGNDLVTASVTAPLDELVVDFGDGDDVLLGASGAWAATVPITARGGAGNDTFFGGAGDDTFIGGEGDDTVDYAGTPLRVIARVNGPVSQDGRGGRDALSEIEILLGSDHDDVLTGSSGDDRIDGRGGDDTIFGAPGDDVLIGGDGEDDLDGSIGADSLDGGPGADRLRGGNGDDTLRGGEGDDDLGGADGADQLFGGSGADVLDGGRDADRLDGEEGDDTLRGGEGDDDLAGGAGADTLLGENGTDRLDGGSGDDLIDGGSGSDTLAFAGALGGVSVGLADLRTSDDGQAGSDTLRNVEGAAGTPFDDVLLGDHRDNTLEGGGGADQLEGRGGRDTLRGDAGADTIDGGDGDDRIEWRPGDGSDTVHGGAGSGDELIVTGTPERDVVQVGPAAPGGSDAFSVTVAQVPAPFSELTARGVERVHIEAGAGDDEVSVLATSGDLNTVTVDFADGNDTLIGAVPGGDDLAATVDITARGGAGDDLFAGGRGRDRFFGGEGEDTIDYGAVPGPLIAQLGATGTADGRGGADELREIERLLGSDHADQITSRNPAGAFIDGRGGDDLLIGGAGDDLLIGGDGHDRLYGMGGGDLLEGGAGNDRLSGNGGDDRLDGGAGNDHIDGGSGDDLVIFTEAQGGVEVDLAAGQTADDGEDGADTLTGVEGAAGTAFDDVLVGDERANRLIGGDGDDQFFGGAGNDTLIGSAGNDLVDGGAGSDSIVWSPLDGSDTIDGGAGANDRLLVAGTDGDDSVDIAAADDPAADVLSVTVTLPPAEEPLVAHLSASGIEDLEVALLDGEDEVLVHATAGTVLRHVIVDLGAGDDRLVGAAVVDGLPTAATADITAHGGAGDDAFIGGAGDDVFFGGAGVDTADYAIAPAAVIARLDGRGQNDGRGGVDELREIEWLLGSEHDDRLTGSSGADLIDGRGGHDAIFGLGGDDDLRGGSGDDDLRGGSGDDTLRGGPGDDHLDGGSGANVLIDPD